MIYYFDNCATTRVDDDTAELISRYHTEKYFNPSSLNTFSLEVSKDIAESRRIVADAVGANPDEIYFVSGGTEADNIAVLGSVRNKKGNVVITAAEHSAAYETALQLKNRGADVRVAAVTADGRIDAEDFVSKVDGQTLLAVFMHVNNETGAVNDIKRLNCEVKRKNGNALTFSDGVQAVGKIALDLHASGIDMYSCSGHKIHCSKGTGFLYIKKGVHTGSVFFGGGQEKGLRSGTEYTGGCVALGRSVKKAVSMLEENTGKFLQYKKIIAEELSGLSDFKEICPHTVSPAIYTLAFAGIKSEVLMHMLEKYGIIVGTGSACSSKNKHSRILSAIGLEQKYSEGVVRISFSKYNDKEQVKFLAEKLRISVEELRRTVIGKRP